MSETVTAREVRRRESYQQHLLPEVDVLLRVAQRPHQPAPAPAAGAAHDPDLTFEVRAATDSEALSAEDIVMDRRFDAAVEWAVVALPAKFREVLMLVDVQGLTYAAAADVLQVPEGTVMSRLHRARKRVRESLATSGLAPRRRS